MEAMTCFRKRRTQVLEQMLPNSMMLVRSGDEVIRNRDVGYDFRAHSDFHYLTGFDEPEAVLCLVKKTLETQTQVVVFVRPKDPLLETWEGRRLGGDEAAKTLEVDEAFSIETLDEQLAELSTNMTQLYTSFSDMQDWYPLLSELIATQKAKARQGVQAPRGLMDSDVLLHEMRLIKTDEEIALIKQAAAISVQGHLAAMRCAKHSKYEYQVQSALESTFRDLGSPRVAFASIVASGDNACILHYTENRAILQQDQLVLVDAGAEFEGYAGDITTTFPVSGKFSKPQAEIYSLVLAAQEAAKDAIKVGAPYDAMHQAAVQVVTEGLIALGLIDMTVEKALEAAAYKAFFMHGTGHWLGRDVHDVGDYKVNQQWRSFEVGMVVTVEPGIYISPELEGVADQYKGIGVRIEDDVLVTKTGGEVLTLGLPRTVAEIEAFMAEA